jgi:hypothetical protein
MRQISHASIRRPTPRHDVTATYELFFPAPLARTRLETAKASAEALILLHKQTAESQQQLHICAGRRQRTSRNNKPHGIHEDKVHPEVEWLGPGVYLPGIDLVEDTGGEIQPVAVDMARGHERLDRMPVRRVSGDEQRRQERERTPRGLHRVSEERGPGRDSVSYHRGGFNGEEKGIGDHVPRIRQGVLLPELAEEVLHAGHPVVVEDEITLKEDVDGARCEEIRTDI